MNKNNSNHTNHKLLSPTDPTPSKVINASSNHPVLLVCEHAGQAIPQKLNQLGISQTVLDTHIGWDIGAKKVTSLLAQQLNATAIFQNYSRLVIDCNRPPEAPDAMPEVSDGSKIPGNFNLDIPARNARIDEIFTPYQNIVTENILAKPRQLVLSIHSFTPTMNGQNRPWELGFLFRKDSQTPKNLSSFIHDINPKLNIGMNEPYQIDNESDWFIPKHGEANNIAHSLIEIRNDQISTPKGQALWANYLTTIINRYLKEL